MRNLIDSTVRAVNSTILSLLEATTVAVVRDDSQRREVYAVLSGVRVYMENHPYRSWNPLFSLDKAAKVELTENVQAEMDALVEVSRLKFDEERAAAARDAILRAFQKSQFKTVEVPGLFGAAS